MYVDIAVTTSKYSTSLAAIRKTAVSTQAAISMPLSSPSFPLNPNRQVSNRKRREHNAIRTHCRRTSQHPRSAINPPRYCYRTSSTQLRCRSGLATLNIRTVDIYRCDTACTVHDRAARLGNAGSGDRRIDGMRRYVSARIGEARWAGGGARGKRRVGVVARGRSRKGAVEEGIGWDTRNCKGRGGRGWHCEGLRGNGRQLAVGRGMRWQHKGCGCRWPSVVGRGRHDAVRRGLRHVALGGCADTVEGGNVRSKE